MDLSKQVMFSEKLFVQEVDGEFILLDMQSQNYFGLDAVASDIWRIFNEGKNLAETVKTLQETYEVDEDTLYRDLEIFVRQLIDNGLATLS